MADTKISVQTEKPAVVSYDSFDVFNGKGGLSRDEYKAATFHATGDTAGDASFKAKAELMGSSGSELEGEAVAGETQTEREEESKIGG